MKYEPSTVYKLSSWAGSLDSIDFLDYWYNLSLTDLKFQIEDNFMNKVNAFDWTRWQRDFEREYTPIAGEPFSKDERTWFAAAVQYLTYALQSPSKTIAVFYGRQGYKALMDHWFQYHCFGVDQFIKKFITEFGLPPEVETVHVLSM